jgi:hypothetical protein
LLREEGLVFCRGAELKLRSLLFAAYPRFCCGGVNDRDWPFAAEPRFSAKPLELPRVLLLKLCQPWRWLEALGEEKPPRPGAGVWERTSRLGCAWPDDPKREALEFAASEVRGAIEELNMCEGVLRIVEEFAERPLAV